MKNPIENIWGWWFDESVKLFLLSWYLPTFIIGNYDDWLKMGITLNGVKKK